MDGEWRLAVQTAATTVGCAACGSQARLHARRTVRVWDLPIGGRPVVLAWRKRVWRCGEPTYAVQTWTEQQAAIRPRAVLTERARAEEDGRTGRLDPEQFLARRREKIRYANSVLVKLGGDPNLFWEPRLDGPQS